MEAHRFSAAVDELNRSDGATDMPQSLFVDCFPVDGASVSTIGDLLGSETIGATDDLAARIDELQFDLGEGPAWEAMSRTRAVVDPDMRAGSSGSWPAFAEAIANENVGAIIALPMVIGPLRVGAIDLYASAPTHLDGESIRQGEDLARIVARAVLKQALARVGREHEEQSETPRSRRVLHQATGMVLAQLRLTPADARLVIEGHAFANGLPVLQVAQRIVDRDLTLTLSGDGSDD